MHEGNRTRYFPPGQRLALGDVVAVPFGNLDHVLAGAGDDGLAAEARIQLLIGGHVQAVQLIVVGLADAALILDPQVAGGAGADAAAGVIEKDVVVLRHIEKRHRLAVMLVRHCAEFKLDRPAFGLKVTRTSLSAGMFFRLVRS